MFEPLLLLSIINMIYEIFEPGSDEKYPGRQGLCIQKDTLLGKKKDGAGREREEHARVGFSVRRRVRGFRCSRVVAGVVP